jgi:CheY-like chemotaxis protein
VPQTLLLADDSVTIQRVIELTFADEDIDVVAVSDGDQAIARLTRCRLTSSRWMSACRARAATTSPARKHTPHLSHIPVVLLTGAFEPVDEERPALGCDGVLANPCEPQMVISRVKELLARPAAEAPEPAPAYGLAAFAPEMRIAAPVVAAVPAANADATAKLDEYFDQLDSAFARFTNVQPVKPSDIAPAVAADATPAELDWFGPPPASEPAGLDPSLLLLSPPTRSGLQLPDSAELVQKSRPRASHDGRPGRGRGSGACARACGVKRITAPANPSQLASIAVGEPVALVPVVPTLPRELHRSATFTAISPPTG